MRAFSVAASQIWMPNIPLSAIPVGSYYGRVRIDYTAKVRDKVVFVTNKNGQRVFNSNGTPKMRVVYKIVKKCHVMTYIITDTVPVQYPNGSRAYNAWVQYDDRDNRWVHTTLVDSACLENLNRFICNRVEKMGDNIPTPAKNVTVYTTGMRQSVPRRKEVQKQYLYRGKWH